MKTFIVCVVLIAVWLIATLGFDPVVVVNKARAGGVALPRNQYRKILKEVGPEYPVALRQTHTEGIVVVRFSVLPEGTVGPVTVKYATKAELGPLATAAVQQWIFSANPAGDKRVTKMEVPITFAAGQ